MNFRVTIFGIDTEATIMRPNATTDDTELYECFDCGARVEAPDDRVCEGCGGRLRNITRSRDL